jgi:protein-tyrosine phosphatase
MNVFTKIICPKLINGDVNISPRLFIGDNIIANNTTYTDHLDAMVNCTELANPSNFKGEIYRMNIIDTESHNAGFYSQLSNVIQFIHTQLSNNKSVMIYCEWGVSRSSSILCAYLIYIKHLDGSLVENCKFIMNLRPFAFHSGTIFRFAESLNKYQKALGYKFEELQEQYPKNHFVKFYWS